MLSSDYERSLRVHWSRCRLSDSARIDALTMGPHGTSIILRLSWHCPPRANRVAGQHPNTVVTNINFDAATGVDATGGAEQPVWDPSTHKFYLSIAEISGDGLITSFRAA